MRSSNQYLNKENVDMRSTSGHMQTGYNTSQQENPLTLLNKTTSFLHAATLNGNVSTKNSKPTINNFVKPQGQYMSQTS